MDEQRVPVVTGPDLRSLDSNEIVEGYNDGREGFPCSGNRSRAYWHGWQNGMVDSGRMEITSTQRLLVRNVVSAS